jgi:probable rRNA maturation factor
MNDPSPTDVLTFDLREAPNAPLEGDVAVSVDTARREAAARGLPVARELLRYVIHGTLHLIGYDDRTPALRSKMRRAENRILRRLDASRRSARGV